MTDDLRCRSSATYAYKRFWIGTTYMDHKNVVCYRVLIEPGRTLRVLVDSCFRSDFESCFRFFDSYGFEWQLDVFLAECNLKHG